MLQNCFENMTHQPQYGMQAHPYLVHEAEIRENEAILPNEGTFENSEIGVNLCKHDQIWHKQASTGRENEETTEEEEYASDRSQKLKKMPNFGERLTVSKPLKKTFVFPPNSSFYKIQKKKAFSSLNKHDINNSNGKFSKFQKSKKSTENCSKKSNMLEKQAQIPILSKNTQQYVTSMQKLQLILEFLLTNNKHFSDPMRVKQLIFTLIQRNNLQNDELQASGVHMKILHSEEISKFLLKKYFSKVLILAQIAKNKRFRMHIGPIGAAKGQNVHDKYRGFLEKKQRFSDVSQFVKHYLSIN